mmetsp:Transcript_5359/g.13749  ORF Transcript_5359/g.13749 Transcript_5359/m.13749 type:complete len:131 (-) Transcript_5359:88-480(-)
MRCSFSTTRWLAVVVAAQSVAAFSVAHPKQTTMISPLRFMLTSEEVSCAMAGGTVGVLGSVLAIEAKKLKIQKSKECPYCEGVGSLPAGDGSGARVVCENCKGRGRFIPTFLDRRASRDPETSAEDVGLL